MILSNELSIYHSGLSIISQEEKCRIHTIYVVLFSHWIELHSYTSLNTRSVAEGFLIIVYVWLAWRLTSTLSHWSNFFTISTLIPAIRIWDWIYWLNMTSGVFQKETWPLFKQRQFDNFCALQARFSKMVMIYLHGGCGTYQSTQPLEVLRMKVLDVI